MTFDESQSMAAELRQSLEADYFEELEITEAETELGRLRRRPLAGVWEEAMHRGDRVAISGAFGAFTGAVDFVGEDYATVVDDDRMLDVRLDRCVLRVIRSRSGGHTVSGGSRTFTARLSEYAATGEPLTVIAPRLGTDLAGRIRLVATDHLLIAPELTVPLTTIDAVVRSR